MLLVIFLLACGLAVWVTLFVWSWVNARGLVTVSGARDFPLSEHPKVSILIPARNEEEVLRSALPRFLEQEYDNYEVILVDDASSDGTPELAGEYLAQYPDRLRALRVEELPSGWVGKSFALHTGFQAAQGEWILATDADILFHPKALRAGLWLACQHQADLVSIFCFVECVSFWEKLLIPALTFFLATFFPFRKNNDPRSSVAIASGGYILMRRSVWADLGGYETLQSEMIDDLNTARLVKHSGHRIFGAVSKDLLSTRMYESFQETWEGLRKNAFAAHHYSAARLLGTAAGLCFINLLPLAALCYSAVRILQGESGAQVHAIFALSCAQYLLAVILSLPTMLYFRIGAWYALLGPLASVIYSFIEFDSMIRTLFGGGVSWKLRRYGKPIETGEQ